MKKLLSRSFLVMLTAAVLVTAALVTNCDGSIERNSQGAEEDSFIPYDPPADMGYIRIKLSNNSRATFQPTAPASVGGLFYHVEIETVPGGVSTGEIGTSSSFVSYGSLTTSPIPMAAGTYKVTVYASATAATPSIIGKGIDSSVTVVTGSGGTATVNLEPIYNNGSGTFKWAITLPSNYPNADTDASATFSVYNYVNGKGSVVDSINGLDLVGTPTNLANSTGITLPSGFYQIEIEMKSVAVLPTLQYRKVTHIFHIANGLTTTFTTGQMSNLNRYAYPVIFNHNNDEDVTNSHIASVPETTKNYAHGVLIPSTDAPAATYQTYPTYSVRGWYRTKASADDADPTKPAVEADRWKFESDRLITDQKLYAGWGVAVGITLSIDYTIGSAPEFSPDTHIFFQSDYNNASLESVTATLPSLPSGLSVVDWKYQGNDSWVNPAGSTSNSVLLTNNAAGVAYLAVGTHTFSVWIRDTNKDNGSGGDMVWHVDFTLDVRAHP